MSSLLNIQFGAGVATLTPNAGNLPTNPTPTRMKVMQEGSIDFKGELKKLFGQQQFALVTARGKVDATSKLKIGALDVNDINQVMFADALVSGGNAPFDETHAMATSITPTQGSGLTVTSDKGVINGDTGLSMLKVASSPTVGQYTFTPAVTGGSPTAASYGFNASETASKVILSFDATVTTGKTLTINNQAMGWAPVCSLALFNKFRGFTEYWNLNSVTLGNFTRPTKMDDFWITDVDISINADAAGVVGTLYTG
jgi:hypothetical protein